MTHTPRRYVLILFGLLAVAATLGFAATRGISTAAESRRAQAEPPADVAVQALAAGDSHTCALHSGGVLCWGDNAYGQLGDGTTTTRLAPVSVVGLSSGVQALAAGDTHTCAMLGGGGVMCWGFNGSGQLGDGTTTARLTPVSVSGLSAPVQAITVGGSHTCALAGDGMVCWGANYSGQLGDGTLTHRSAPVSVAGLNTGVQALAAGGTHTCALRGGGVLCWGYNASGQLGDGTTTQRTTPAPVNGLGSGVQALTAGEMHTCALLSGGGVMCWGNNLYGQLGDGSTTQRTTPVSVSGLSIAAHALTAGVAHTCVLVGGGVAQCWGYNASGQLGDGTTTNRVMPVSVSGLGGAVQAITAGGFHTCALLGGSVRCWGRNTSGQLGDGTTTNRSTPVYASGLAGPVQVLAAGEYHTCALLGGGGVRCWGRNTSGQLGDGTMSDRTTPVNVSGLSTGVLALAAGGSHTCALVGASGVKCWGDNASGQLGDGTTTNRTTPVSISGRPGSLGRARALAGGGSHTCALFIGGGVQCWGANGSGQLGDGTQTPRPAPVDVTGLGGPVQALAASGGHTCALLSGGAVQCWGYNGFGQLGDGTLTQRNTPVNVIGLSSGVQALTAGGSFTCALLGDGMKCWGSNGFGQLGDGTRIDHRTPASVTGLGGAVEAIAAGWYHTCALLSNGGMQCWGDNLYGQLGDGTLTQRTAPVSVAGLGGPVEAIAADHDHTCASLRGGVMCWGANGYGQLGDGSRTSRATPVEVGGLGPAPTPAPTPTPTPTPTMPDANRNGVTDSTDALCILRLLGSFAATTNCPVPLPFGDVNGSGDVSSVDALCVLRYLGRFARVATCPYDPPA